MRNEFAQTSNVHRFMAAIDTAERRGAREAGMVLVTGDPGFGKTATVHWWAIQNGAIYLRAKAAYTPFWFLSELTQKLKAPPLKSTKELYDQALALIGREQRPIIVDEVEHALHDFTVLETVRGISDIVEVPVILVGMEQVQERLARYAQISSRIASVVLFKAASLEDVRVLCDTLCEVPVADDLVVEIHRQSGGRNREILNAIAIVERFGRGPTGGDGERAICLADLEGQSLTHDWQARKPRTIKRR
jgi:DNA transposition AAA+ family ATPase